MVCSADDLLKWKDFPKGLRVLLLDQDPNSSSAIKSKLEQMDYIVTAFFTEEEALLALSSENERFHVAIVEVGKKNCNGTYKFLETSKDLPTIITAKEHCLIGTMMKCIALGAVEFLIKPLSEEKLRNIWQHVVHKAFNTNRKTNSESLKYVKEFVGSVLEMQQVSKAAQTQVYEEPKDDTEMDQSEWNQSAADKFPAPSTPQIKQGERSLDDRDYHDQVNSSPDKDGGEVEGETKSVDTTYDATLNNNMEVDPPQPISEASIKEEDDSGDGLKGSDSSVLKPREKENDSSLGDSLGKSSPTKDTTPLNRCGSKSNRKKMKVDWTPELHKKFVQAVEQLGVDQAIPSRILELMKVEGLTRHNVASHLQKYRMHRRHILPKGDERRWPQPRDLLQRSYYPPHRPVMAYPPPYHTNHAFAPGQVYPVWGPHDGRSGVPMWPPPPPPYPWQPVENWHWKPHPGMHADAWGCPVMPSPPCPLPAYSQAQSVHGFPNLNINRKNSADAHPGEEVIDKVVKEAISKPWLPLPIGLKPPSTDSVLSELSRQGISAIPPHINGHHHH